VTENIGTWLTPPSGNQNSIPWEWLRCRKNWTMPGAGHGSLVPGFKCGDIERGFIEQWIAAQERDAAKLQASTLLWAQIAANGRFRHGARTKEAIRATRETNALLRLVRKLP
jgi:hypothetical protein